MTPFVSSYPVMLALNKLQLMIHLGVPEEERRTPQAVLVSFWLYFKEAPSGCYDDKLQDATCYHRLSNLLKDYCEGKEFHLIEYLGHQLYREIRKTLEAHIRIGIAIEKSVPAIEGLQGPATFWYSDAV